MLACFVWQTEGNFDNQAKVKIAHEYILAYAKNLDKFPPPPVIDPTIPKDSKLYRENIQNTIVKNGPGNPVSEVTLPRGFPASFEEGTIQKRHDLWPHYATDAVVTNYSLQNEVVVSSGWSSKRIFLRFVESGFKPVKDTKGQDTTFVLTRTGAIEAIKKRSEEQSHVISVLRNVGTTQQMSVDLAQIGIKFDYPKPVGLIKYLIRMVKGSSFSVLDFFAGCGTTARAVLEINEEDPTRQLNFILVEIKEDIVSICLKHLKSVMRDDEGVAVCRLGSSLFGPSGQIAGEVTFAELARHIFFVETGEPMMPRTAGKSPLLGVSQGVAVYLLYNGILGDKTPDGGNALTRSVLERLPQYDGPKVIYGTSCRLGEERLRAEAITFKQIPYAIKTL